jgi:hypothetical protein
MALMLRMHSAAAAAVVGAALGAKFPHWLLHANTPPPLPALSRRFRTSLADQSQAILHRMQQQQKQHA